MTRGGAIARRYARALFAIGEERGGVRELLSEIDSLTDEIVECDELRRVLFAPIHPRNERRGVLFEVCTRLGVSQEVRAFSGLLLEENRIPLLSAIREELRGMVDRTEGRVVAEITSARPLEQEEVSRLTEALSRRLGVRVTVSLEVDPSLLGGVRARVGDLLLDGSVRTQLASLASSLRRGPS